MTHTQHFTRTIRKQLNRHIKNRHSLMRVQQSVFYQRHNWRTDWLQYLVNFVTRLPIDFQQKTNINLNDCLDHKIILGISNRTQYSKWCLFCDFSAINIFKHGNPIKINKYNISKMNKLIKVILSIKSTYPSKWCTTIPNNYPVPL